MFCAEYGKGRYFYNEVSGRIREKSGGFNQNGFLIGAAAFSMDFRLFKPVTQRISAFNGKMDF